jgi:hypothetical protein
MRNAANNPFQRFCKQTSEAAPSLWADLLRRAQPDATNPVEEDSDEEGDEWEDFEPDDDLGLEGASLEEEADELAGDEGEVGVAPHGPLPPLRVLDVEHLSGVGSDATGALLPKTLEGYHEAHLRANGRTIATFKGTLKGGEPHGHGRLEMGLDGWRGQMAYGAIDGNGQAWDEAGNTFTGNTSAPRWLLDAVANEVRRTASAARKAHAPFDVTNAKHELKPLKCDELRAALRTAGADDKGLKAVLQERLLEVRRQAHLAAQSSGEQGELKV